MMKKYMYFLTWVSLTVRLIVPWPLLKTGEITGMGKVTPGAIPNGAWLPYLWDISQLYPGYCTRPRLRLGLVQ